MTWMYEHRRAWRSVALLLAAVAFAGPWAYERIYIPAEIGCSPPNVLFKDGSCGTPLRGALVVPVMFGSWIWLVHALVGMDPDQAFRAFFLLEAATLTVLPLLTTFLLILDQGGDFRIQVLAWGMAALAGPYLARTNFSSPHAASWGIWLYIGLAAGASVLELLALVADRQPGLAQAPER